jgi:hypothetical protein
MIKIKFFLPDESDDANHFLEQNGNANGVIAYTTNGIYVTYEDGVFTDGMKKTVLFNKMIDAQKKKTIVEADYNRDAKDYSVFSQEVVDLKEKIANCSDPAEAKKLKGDLKTSEDAAQNASNQMLLQLGTMRVYDKEIDGCKLVLEAMNHA